MTKVPEVAGSDSNLIFIDLHWRPACFSVESFHTVQEKLSRRSTTSSEYLSFSKEARSSMMQELLQAEFILLLIGVSAAQRLGSENQHSAIRAGSEVSPRQFNGGSLGETVNNLTKDYIRGVVNPTPEEVILQKLSHCLRLTLICRRCVVCSTNLPAITSSEDFLECPPWISHCPCTESISILFHNPLVLLPDEIQNDALWSFLETLPQKRVEWFFIFSTAGALQVVTSVVKAPVFL